MKKFLSKILNGLLSEQGLFLLLVLFEVIQIAYLIWEPRLVLHDTFFRFSLQYYFLNNTVISGEIPQWIPYVTQGSPASPYFGIYGIEGMFSNLLLHIGKILRGENFLIFFYLDVLFAKILFLIGVWLLSKRYFSSKFTVFFVASSAMSSTLWMSQSYFSLYIFYAIPLVLSLIHSFLETGKWRYLFFGINLYFMQIVNTTTYFVPVSSLTIVLYFLFYFILKHRVVGRAFGKAHFGRQSWFTLLGLIVSFLIVYFILVFSFEGKGVSSVAKRNIDGSVPLNVFLHYEGKTTIFMWIELLLGFSIARDSTLYIGILSVPCIVLGLAFNRDKKRLSMLALIIILLLFSMSTVVSVALYYSWPLMKFYRHLSLISPMIKVFLCFLAGFGFEAIFLRLFLDRNKRFVKTSFILIGIILGGLGGYFYMLSGNVKQLSELFYLMGFSSITDQSSFIKNQVASLFKISSLKILLAGILIWLVSCIRHKKHYLKIMTIFLIFHILDVYSYAFYETNKRTVPLSPQQYELLKFKEMPYFYRRTQTIENNPRAEILSKKLLRNSAHYWTINAFLFNDELGTSFNTRSWQEPLDDFMRAYEGQSLESNQVKLKSFQEDVLKFPQDHIAARKFSGLDEDKIQFFSSAYFLPNKKAVAQHITDLRYRGDILFLSRPKFDIVQDEDTPLLWSSENLLTMNQRLKLSYKILKFDANHLRIEMDNPEDKTIWMFYSDVWHSDWKAMVNGCSTPIYKANLAYKAIALSPGRNKVHFYFHSEWWAFLVRLVGLNSLFWVIMIFWLAGNICFRSDKKQDF